VESQSLNNGIALVTQSDRLLMASLASEPLSTAYVGSEQAHPLYVGLLASNICCAHVDHACPTTRLP
jgi:hypothetical protein